MNLPRIVVDNSAIIPAFFPEPTSDLFDAGLVSNRARSLVRAVRDRRVNAFAPPSFFREFLNVAIARLDVRAHAGAAREHLRAQWDDLLSLPFITVPLNQIIHHAGSLALDEFCPPADSWYVATAAHTRATFWVSHVHADGLVEIASRHVTVQLLSRVAPAY